MQPHVYIEHGTITYGPFGDSQPNNIDEILRIGYIDECHGDWRTPAIAYQTMTGVGGKWCPSRWETIPDDALWRARGLVDSFCMYVRVANLDFRNTPLEQMYNLSLQGMVLNGSERMSELETLARNERLLWEGVHKTYIPFKKPHPQGYQGIWVNLREWPESICEIIYVHDRFSPTHLLEISWETN